MNNIMPSLSRLRFLVPAIMVALADAACRAVANLFLQDRQLFLLASRISFCNVQHPTEKSFMALKILIMGVMMVVAYLFFRIFILKKNNIKTRVDYNNLYLTFYFITVFSAIMNGAEAMFRGRVTNYIGFIYSERGILQAINIADIGLLVGFLGFSAIMLFLASKLE